MIQDPPTPRPRRRRALALALVAAGGVLLGVSVLATQRSSTPSARAAVATVTSTPPTSTPPVATGVTSSDVRGTAPGATTAPTTTAPTTIAPTTTTAGTTTTERAVAASASTPVAPSSIRLGDAVEAPVVPVGVLPNGELLLPDDPTVTGWWSGGAAAGSTAGSIVIAGHVDSYRFGLGTFAVLHDLQPGDPVVLGDGAGRTHAYRVVLRQQVPKPALPADLFTPNGPARLVLITCGGSFDESSRHYRDNVIVVAEPA